MTELRSTLFLLLLLLMAGPSAAAASPDDGLSIARVDARIGAGKALDEPDLANAYALVRTLLVRAESFDARADAERAELRETPRLQAAVQEDLDRLEGSYDPA
ncbi:MAG TPA: hypothetical protein VLA56_21015, partial [Pseudomonadales bacterium]|nr:hypothetical protein [Pseudomonadales bacterium]